MSTTTEGDRSKEVTLAFELSAFKDFANPERVLTDAREWSRYVGLIANDTDAVRSYVQEHDIRQDFDLGDRDKWLILAELYDETETDRHVFVGTSEDDRMAAEQTGWEFISITDAAEKAGWTLSRQTEQSAGILDRLRARLPYDMSPFEK